MITKFCKKKVIIGIFGIIGASLLLFLILSNSVGITPDSVAYISVARNLTNGVGFVTSEGSDFVLQPPFYSLVLASSKTLFSIDPITFAGYLNAVLLGAIVILSGLLLLKLLKSFFLVLLGTLSIIFSYAIVHTSMFALSETLFLFLLLLFLYFLSQYQSNQSSTSLLLISIAGSLACLTRYSGVVIVITGIISVLFSGRTTIKVKTLHLIFYTLISVLPISIWMIRNYYLSGALTGQRADSSYSLIDNFSFFYQTVLAWFLPVNLIGNIIFVIIFTGVICYLIKLFSKHSSRREMLNLIGINIIFVILYSGMIIVSSTTTAYDQISNRLLSPIFIPLVFILFFIFDQILIWMKKVYQQNLIKVLFLTCVVLFVSYPSRNTAQMLQVFDQSSEWSYNSASWRESETIEYLLQNRQIGENFELYSNEPEAVYILTKLKTKRSPSKTFYNSPKLYNLYINPMDDMQKAKNVCLIWFDKSNRDFLFSIDELQIQTQMKEIAHLKDGDIYTFTKK